MGRDSIAECRDCSCSLAPPLCHRLQSNQIAGWDFQFAQARCEAAEWIGSIATTSASSSRANIDGCPSRAG